MDTLEKMVEAAAADLVMADVEDLPALAGLHEHFLNIGRAVADKAGLIARASAAAANLMQKIILNEVEDRVSGGAGVGGTGRGERR
jgi:hypothetical protein